MNDALDGWVARPLRGRVIQREGNSFPGRLHHAVPSWVKDGAVFHIRIRCAAGNERSLIDPDCAAALLVSARLYEEKDRWFCHLFLLMPDHLHALLSFPRQESMSRVIGDWKHYQARKLGIRWQENYFDHRIRNDAELVEKAAYIRRNPVAKQLCAGESDWPWMLSKAI